jgi:hypothetical protein
MRDLPPNIASVARFHIPLTKDREEAIRRTQRARLKNEPVVDIRLTPEEVVEDAGLDDEVLLPSQDSIPMKATRRPRPARKAA